MDDRLREENYGLYTPFFAYMRQVEGRFASIWIDWSS